MEEWFQNGPFGIKKAHRRGNDETRGVDNDKIVDQDGKSVVDKEITKRGKG